MRLYLGVTDDQLFHHLRSQPQLDEVNFWQPSGHSRFRALSPGEPFLFKLHAPRNFVVGGGFFAHSSLLPAYFAWEVFGQKNGARTYEEMREHIARYRRAPLDSREDPTIGCIILTQPFFFDEIDWIPVPEDWSASIVQGKTYDADRGPGQALWERAASILRATEPIPVREPQIEMFGEPRVVYPRLGQGSFRVLITDTYERRCAVTGEKALPVLEAAHIREVADGGLHRVDNGLLLRSDLHRLFARGYATVTPDHRFRVSHRLKDDFDDGEPYYPLDGQEIWLPTLPEARPRRQFLEWHANSRFLG